MLISVQPGGRTQCIDAQTKVLIRQQQFLDNNAMHAKPDLRVEFEPDGHFFRLGDLCRYPAKANLISMSDWKCVGAVAEGDSILVGGLDPWRHKWDATTLPAVKLPHPTHPNQFHGMRIYEISHSGSTVRFAAGELSASVWGFYVPESQSHV